MADSAQIRTTAERVVTPGENPIVIRVEASGSGSSVTSRLLLLLLMVSLAANVVLWVRSLVYSPPPIPELHKLGTPGAAARIAVIPIEGTITPPFTNRWIRQIERAAEDESVRGVVLQIDSPGGFVADSHELYRAVQRLAEVKPVHVAMKRLTASGGYYLAMGVGLSGRILAEPTTWTGSIGVIIPRYDASQFAKSVGVEVQPLVTGKFKDSLNPFRALTEDEQQVWDAILQDSFDRFVEVIVTGRSKLDEAAVRELATGQIYTARQALDNHLIDEIGYLQDAVQGLADQLHLTEYEAIEYRSTPGLVDLVLGAKAEATPSFSELLLESTVPRAMYYCSWSPWVPKS